MCKGCEVINKTHLNFGTGCLQFFIETQHKVEKIYNIQIGLVFILWNGLLFILSIK